jgi:hypothetical protein
MKFNEIVSGEMDNPNVPIFNNPEHVCDNDGYPIMTDIWNGYRIFGILDDQSGKTMSYVVLEDMHKDNLFHFWEIYTMPAARGKNLGGIILTALRGKLGIRLFIDKNDVVSDLGRSLILNLVKNNRIDVSSQGGVKLSYDDLKVIFDKPRCSNSLIIEGCEFMSYETKFHKDQILSIRWRLRDPKTGSPLANELYD